MSNAAKLWTKYAAFIPVVNGLFMFFMPKAALEMNLPSLANIPDALVFTQLTAVFEFGLGVHFLLSEPTRSWYQSCLSHHLLAGGVTLAMATGLIPTDLPKGPFVMWAVINAIGAAIFIDALGKVKK